MTFEIRLLADDPDFIEASRKEIIQQATRFVVRMLDHNTCGINSQPSGPDQRVIVDLMLKHLQSDKGIRFFQESAEHGHDLYHLLPWSRSDPAQPA